MHPKTKTKPGGILPPFAYLKESASLTEEGSSRQSSKFLAVSDEGELIVK